MGIDADAAAAALAASWQRLVDAVPTGWARRDGGAIAVVTGVQLRKRGRQLALAAERAYPEPLE